ncbi:MAG: hypothetical protein JKY80_09330 [Mariprofundaceae bacterium]|nr:hypothetical protein [Mariprofundaceae bacterium]
MRQTLKQEIRQTGQVLVAGLFSLVALTLVLIHIFGIGAHDFKKLFASSAAKDEAKPSKKKTKKDGGKEIRKYSEFITVKHSTLDLDITTGIRFDNSTDQNIEAQWCYASPTTSQKDGLFMRLSIREIEGSKTKDFPPYPIQTLREFNLTQDQAKNLVTLCRFKAP